MSDIVAKSLNPRPQGREAIIYFGHGALVLFPIFRQIEWKRRQKVWLKPSRAVTEVFCCLGHLTKYGVNHPLPVAKYPDAEIGQFSTHELY